MRIIRDELRDIEPSDVINGTVNIPDGVVKIRAFCFFKSNIEYLVMPDSIEELGNEIFFDCQNLKQVVLSNKIKNISNGCFQNCTNLEEVIGGDEVTTIGRYAFSGCMKLKKISFNKLENIDQNAFYGCESLTIKNFPDSLKAIGEFSFSSCFSLDEISLPTHLLEIDNYAFYGCKNLKKVEVNSNLKKIGINCFGECPSLVLKFKSSLFDYSRVVDLKNVFIRDKELTIENTDFHKIQKQELIDVIYARLKENNCTYNLDNEQFTQAVSFSGNFIDLINHILSRINTCNCNFNLEDELNKIAALYPRTRLSNFPEFKIYKQLPLKLASKYNYKQLKQLLNHSIFKYNDDNKLVLMDLIGLFGLFEDDKMAKSRLERLESILDIDGIIDEVTFEQLELGIYKEYFYIDDIQEYNLKDNIEIPNGLDLFLKKKLYKRDVKLINSLNKRLGKQVKEFFVNNYISSKIKGYKIKENVDAYILDDIKNRIYNSEFTNVINNATLMRLFYNSSKNFNDKAINFIFNNFEYIMHNPLFQVRVKDILDRYDEIVRFYNQMGNTDINIIDMVNYLNSFAFYNVKSDNIEFSILAKNAGISSQIHYDEYQKIYEEMKAKQRSSIPRIKKEYLLENSTKSYKVLVEVLRKDDPLVILIGEERYTNCCQKIGDIGEECLRHAATEGRIVAMYLIDDDNNKILLAQSWMWRNGNLLCFDNIEGTYALKKNFLYQKLIVASYKLLTIDIIEEVKRHGDFIDVVTLGNGHSDIELYNYFGECKDLLIMPKNYFGYIDSDKGYYLYGTSRDIDTQIIEPKIYQDERIIIKETGKEIKTQTVSKISHIKELNNDNNYEYLNNTLNCDDSISAIVGDDWFIMCMNDEKEISDFGMINPAFDDEYVIQSHEIEKTIKELKKAGYKLSINDAYVENIYNQKEKIKKG